MSSDRRWTTIELVWAVLAVCFVLFLHGAVPFFALPTLGQAIWSSGFAQSFSNGSIFNFYAHDFGIPKPAAISFGLAAVWPMSLFIRLGLHPADAYSSVFALWFCIAFYGAFEISRCVGARRGLSLLAGVVWLSMPIVLHHAGYSMLSLGIALLPLYFMTAFKLVSAFSEPSQKVRGTSLLFFAVTIVSVFMDGYTFVMFAAGFGIYLAYTFITRPGLRENLLKYIGPIYVSSCACAYLLYQTYIGDSAYQVHGIDFFRGWGLDLVFLLVPTRGVSWLADLAGISEIRSDTVYFGDWSVWTTTFSLPVIILGALAWLLARRHNMLASGLLLIAVFSFWMSLGPSIKFNSEKPTSLQVSHPGQQSALMPAELGIIPTGNAWISESVPGFRMMRASYRWLALCIFAFWLLAVIEIAKTDGNQRFIWMSALIAITVFNLPDLNKQWRSRVEARNMFQAIDQELLSQLVIHIQSGERTAFIPWSNDFLANYLASRGSFKAYNIGGDKNLGEAMTQWPSALLGLNVPLTMEQTDYVKKLLLDGSVDAIIFPCFSLLEAAHKWPQASCMSNAAQSFKGVVERLRGLDYLAVTETDFFAVVRLKSSGAEGRLALKARVIDETVYPIIVSPQLKNRAFILTDGWYLVESQHVWSRAEARLELPVPPVCELRRCSVVLRLIAYGASPQRIVPISFRSQSDGGIWDYQTSISSSADNNVVIPLARNKKTQEISISTANAISPLVLAGSADGRVLGIGLKTIELRIE